ncbi:MAG: DUF6055 domain-containing protein [Odoribacteraceae bacterium]|jgi:hypothetical protein|nr:DUF6055 domain-containing protein [Odoribacteraceae bacterium]
MNDMNLKSIITICAASLFLFACSSDDGELPIEPGDVGYGSSIFSVTKGVDYESPPLELSGFTGEVTVRIKEVRNFTTRQGEPLFFETCEVARWSAPVNAETDKTLQSVLAKYTPLHESALTVEASTGKLTLRGAGSKKIPAGVYLVDLEISNGKTATVKEGACRLQLREHTGDAVEATIGWRVSTSTDNANSPAISRELTGEELEAFAASLGAKYDAASGYLVLKLKDRRGQPVGGRLTTRNAALNTFEKANPWAEITYTRDAIIIPYPVPVYPVDARVDNGVHYRIEAPYNALNKEIHVDVTLATRQKGIFEIACTLADSDIQGKLTVIPAGKKIYKPTTDNIRGMNFYDENSPWSYHHMASSENIVVFWEPGFGDDPAAASVPEALRVNLEELLEKGERYYAYYRDSLRFMVPGQSRSDSLKMIIRVYYTTDWAAYGSGYDYTIGAIWVNPSTMRPVGQTIAHEIGHAFQYQVYCDGLWGYQERAPDGGSWTPNTFGFFWECCAQYMSWQLYPAELTNQLPTFLANCHKGFEHEWVRYQSFPLVAYWRTLHGREFLAGVWRGAIYPEDPVQTYQRVTGASQSRFNDEVWESAARNITWDIPLGAYFRQGIDRESAASRAAWYTHKTSLVEEGDGYLIIAPDTTTRDHGTSLNVGLAPHDYGYNAIPLTVPAAGATVSVDFKGVRGDARYKTFGDARAGWRYGFVGVKADGWTPVYGEMKRDDEGTLSFATPAGAALGQLWLVVSGAPVTHEKHPWDDNASNDEEYPYKVKFTNTTYKK